jgi:hypothetical protein
MELVLIRTYHADGTNGKLYANNSFQCYTIELPWEDNLPQRYFERLAFELYRSNTRDTSLHCFGRIVLVHNFKRQTTILINTCSNRYYLRTPCSPFLGTVLF